MLSGNVDPGSINPSHYRGGGFPPKVMNNQGFVNPGLTWLWVKTNGTILGR